MTWLSQWNFGNQLEGGDEIIVSVTVAGHLIVKECGFKIVYDEQEEKGIVKDDNWNKTRYFQCNEIIGEDLSDLKLSTGAYFLCHRLYEATYGAWYMDMYRKAFQDIVDFEDLFSQFVHMRDLIHITADFASKLLQDALGPSIEKVQQILCVQPSPWAVLSLGGDTISLELWGPLGTDALSLVDRGVLVEICESIECLGKLVSLNLKDCKSLRKLPRNVNLLTSLEKLIISGCSNLVEFPMDMTMESLQVLHADEIAINALFMTTRQVKLWQAYLPSWVSKPRISSKNFVASLPRTIVKSLTVQPIRGFFPRINIVYEEQEKIDKQHNSTYFSWNKVIGGDLSSFQLSTGAYFLCRHSFDYPRDQWETDLLRETFKEIMDLEANASAPSPGQVACGGVFGIRRGLVISLFS
ncbi:hypothetical protein LguiB_021744 [Lonicera macranthoides]